MFARHTPKNFKHKTRDYIWPSMGWKRFARYLYLRLQRQKGSTHSLAIGMAIGFGAAFIPLYGTQFLWIFLLCRILKGNFFAGFISSFIGNPLTFPLIFGLDTVIGKVALGRLDFEMITAFFNGTTDPQIVELSTGLFSGSFFWDTFLPACLGGGILCATIIPITYPINYFLVKEMRLAYKAQKQARFKIALHHRRKARTKK